MNKKFIYNLIKITIFISIISYILSRSDFGRIFLVLKEINIFYLILSLFVSLTVVFMMSYRWRLILEEVGIKKSQKKIFFINYYSQFLNNFFPGFLGGDTYKVLSLGEEKRKVIKSVFIDRITGLIIQGIISIPAIIIIIFLFGKNYFYLIFVFSFFLVALLISVLCFEYIRQKLFLLIKRMSNYMFNPKILLAGLIIFVLMILNARLIFTAIGWKVPLITFIIFIPLINLIASLPLTIRGYGVKEILFIYLLSIDISSVFVFSIISFVTNILHTSLGAIPNLLKNKN
jgi:glycosyltransferase 2 family protein